LTGYASECINILFTPEPSSTTMAIAVPSAADRSSTRTPAPRPRVAVAGATGYAGQELVRILARHPAVTLTAAMSSAATSAPRPLPALARIWSGSVVPLDIDTLARDADIVFLALPETASAELAPKLLERNLRVIDLSGAFRIRGDADRQKWYPATEALPAGTVYGMTESHKDAIRQARLLSNPGCYPTAALLALEPLAKAGLLDGPVIVDAKSGISGAGKAANDRTHFCENHGSVAAYGIFSHRHTAEIEQELQAAGLGGWVTFVPHLVPLDRGILESIYVTLKPATTAPQVAEALEQAYADAPFVRLTGGNLPEIKHVAHTNFCDIGWKVDEERGRAVLVAVLDNLLKGAAGSAVQNLNVMLGIDETTGLLCWPRGPESSSSSAASCSSGLTTSPASRAASPPSRRRRRWSSCTAAARRSMRRSRPPASRSSRSTASASPTPARWTSWWRCSPARSTRGWLRRCARPERWPWASPAPTPEWRR
jgi:N-acetyl-gamma-glutamyl-phosphate reductase